MTLERDPVGLDDAAQDRTRRAEDQHRDEQVAGEIPTPSQQHADDDHERKPEQSHERDPPKRFGPTEDRRQRPPDVLVVTRRGPRD